MAASGTLDITIGDALLVGDGAHASIKREDDGVLYLSSRNFKDGKLDLSKVYYISEADFEKHFKKSSKSLTQTRPGDVALSIIGTIGEPYLVRPNDRFGLSSAVAFMRPKDASVFPQYLYYWLRGPDFQNAVYGIKGGVAQGYVSLEMIRSLPFRKFPLPVQRKIASILGAYDDLIENNLRRIKILEEMAQSLYREWFVNFRFPGHEKHGPRPASNEACKPTRPNTPGWHPSPLGPIPSEWEVSTCGEVAKNFDRLRKPLSGMEREKMQGKYPYYGAAKLLDHVNDYIFDGTYLLVAEDGSVINPDRRPVLQYVKGKFWVNNHTHIIQGNPPVSTEYLCLCLQELDVSGYITGAAQPKITQANMNRIPVLIPASESLYKFNAFIEPIFVQKLILEEKNRNLRQTRDLLLPKLISGEVAVTGVDAAADYREAHHEHAIAKAAESSASYSLAKKPMQARKKQRS